MSAGGAARRRQGTVPLTPDAGPSWLRPLMDNIAEIPDAYKRRLPADVLAMVTAARQLAGSNGRDAAVLVLFSGPRQRVARRRTADSLPDDADLLLTVRASRCATTPARPHSPAAHPIPAMTGRSPPRCGRRARRPGSTPAGCIRWSRWSERSSRRRVSTSSRCWPIRRIQGRWPWSTRPKRRSWRGFRSGRSSIRPTG